MHTKNYIDAVLALLREGRELDDVLRSLRQTLERRGYAKLYIRILQGLVKTLRRSATQKVPLVYVARESDLKKLESEIRAQLVAFKAESYEAETDTTLIGGYVIEHNHKILDNSYKSRLVTLYRSLIE